MPETVVITGSTRGIGRCLALGFLDRGCRVVLSGRSSEPPEPLRGTLAPYDGNWRYVPCDVRVPAAIERLWNEAVAFGGGVDLWINNAGRPAPHALVADLPADAVDDLLATNLAGVIHGSRIAARRMLAQGRGAIWNMEGLGSDDRLQVRTVLYGTSKRALTYFTRGLAKELRGTPVTAGRLSPGMMLTDFILKTPDGAPSDVLRDRSFRFVFNAIGDCPETVATFLVPRMLANRRNDAHLAWLTGPKAMARFLMAPFRRRNLLPAESEAHAEED